MEGAVMAEILANKDALEAARAWLKSNPDAVAPWLEGVTTRDGQPGLEAVQKALTS
jgi:glycine betaine/proline transport system substrate-binding protein